jgi:hypothetical protein
MFSRRYLAMWCAAVLLAVCAALAVTHHLAWFWLIVPLALVALGLFDLTQQRHAILRNYPLWGHLRFLFEFNRPPTGIQPTAPTAKPERRDVAAEALAGLTLKEQVTKQLRAQLHEPYFAGDEKSLAQELVAARNEVKNVASTSGGLVGVSKENADLRGQLAFLKARLEARGGRDYPPCWADEQTGKVEFLFTVEILPAGLRVTPAWPEKRQADAMNLPGMARFSGGTSLSREEFSSAMQGIDRVSKDKNCRHYVYVKNRVTDLASFNKSRYAIENFFYKLELRS